MVQMPDIRQWWQRRVEEAVREPGEGELAVVAAGRRTTGLAWSRLPFIGRDETFGHLIFTRSHVLYRTKDNAKLSKRDVARVGDVDIDLGDIESAHAPKPRFSVKGAPVPPLTTLEVKMKDGRRYSFFLIPAEHWDAALTVLGPSHRFLESMRRRVST
jgi:hypothetical protein